MSQVMRRLSGTWILPAAVRTVTGCTGETAVGIHGAAAIGSALRFDAMGPAVAHLCGQSSRGYSTPQTAPESAQGGEAPAPIYKRVLPMFARNLFRGAKHLPAAPTSDQPASGQSKASGSQEDEDIKELERLRTMDMPGYVEYCKQLRSGTTPPRPRVSPVPRGHPDYHKFMDMRRISYLRFIQHERIGSVMTKEENDRIIAEDTEVLRDRKMLQAIADRTGVYIDLEVKDCIQEFLNTRRLSRRFYRYVKEFGKPMPKSREEQDEAVRVVKRKEAEEELVAALAKRDPATCPLQHGKPWVGAGGTCERTGLRYWQCCGALGVPAGTAQPPHYVQDPDKPEKEVLEERAKIREAQHKFNGRSMSRLRKAFLISQKPRFRDF